jgi:hypothetical protein
VSRRTRTATTISALGVLCFGSLAGGAQATTESRPASSQGRPAITPAALAVTVTVDVSGATKGDFARRFVGLSYESMPREGNGGVNSGKFDALGNYPRLLTTLGPGVIRFGGNSVDRTYAGATPQAVAGLARLVQASGWKVLYSVNAAHFDATTAGADAAAVSQALGPNLMAISCGNEPNAWPNQGHRPRPFPVEQYLAEIDACLSTVRKSAPGAKIAGPDTIGLDWLPAYVDAKKGKFGTLSQHQYGMGNCSGQGGTPEQLISASRRVSNAKTVATAAGQARRAGVPLLMTEVNSASCSGIPGVSNTFASALWAVDYLFNAAEKGASGVYFHGSLNDNCVTYTPLCEVAPHTYAAQPLYYGLLFTSLAGTGRILPTSVRVTGNVAAHAVRDAGGIVRVVVENLNPAAATVSVKAGRVSGTATALRLTAPALNSTGGVKIQGSTVQTDGRFVPGTPNRIRCRTGTCTIDLARYSAVVLTLPE